MPDRYRMIKKLAESYLRTRKNAIHTEISTQFAYRLLEGEAGDEDIVIPAILVHDVGWSQVPEELQLKAFGPKATLPEWNRVHEVEGARIARQILNEAGYELRKIEEILVIIEGHDSRKEGISLNDKLVKDADKLWRYSRKGVEINSRRYEYTFEQYLERLRTNLEGWFLTDSARQIAKTEMAERILEGKALS
jgi:HD superfamily phosphodiesterase